jgi:hypothetical protein
MRSGIAPRNAKMNDGWVTLFLIALLLLPILTGCTARAYGNMKCKGECELTIEREIKEVDMLKPDSTGSSTGKAK